MFYKSIKSRAEQFLGNYKRDNPVTFAAAEQAIGGLLILDGFIGIDNPLGGKKRSGIFGSLMSVVVGLIFVFGIGFIASFIGVNKLTATTTATVVGVSQPTYTNTGNNDSSGDSTCTPQAKYTVGGKEYTQTASISSSGACSLTQGQTININYDPNNPGKWAYDLSAVKTILKLFPIIGAIVAVTGLVTFVIRLLSIIFGWKLLKDGRALAKTLPAGTDLSDLKNEVRRNFAKSIFGMDGPDEVAAQPAPQQPLQLSRQSPQPPQTLQPLQPPQAPQPPLQSQPPQQPLV